MDAQQTTYKTAFQTQFSCVICARFDSGIEGNGRVCSYEFHSDLRREGTDQATLPRGRFHPGGAAIEAHRHRHPLILIILNRTANEQGGDTHVAESFNAICRSLLDRLPSLGGSKPGTRQVAR